MNKVLPMRKLGTSGPQISEVGLGTWAIGGPWRFGWGEQEDRVSEETILASLEQGINWVDTAPAYGLGKSEEILGRVLGSRRRDVLISSKCGIVWSGPTKIRFDMSPSSIRSECEASLRRLKTDHIDIYQIHWPDQKTLVEDAWAEMVRLKQEGKVGCIGLSNFNLKQIRRCHKISPVEFVQLPLSILRREALGEVYQWCEKTGAGFLAYSPMQSGLLTGKCSREWANALPAGDWRKKDSFFREPVLDRALALADRLADPGNALGKSIAAMAVAWVLYHRGVTSAIVGARTPGQAMTLGEGSGWNLPDHVYEEIGKICRELQL